jgi:glyoxylase-like metal-dependent hydrolase (beta-lactamase superfamily II)
MGRIVEPSPANALPQITFTEDLTLHLDSTTSIHVMHVHHAHTDGDSFVYFPESNIIHMGDTFFKGRYPFIDLSSGGSIDGLIKAVNHALLIVNDQTKIIPGHGTVANRQDLLDYRDVIMTIRQRVKMAMDSGKKLEEIQEMGLTKEWDETHGQAFINPQQIVEFVYKSLSGE